MYKYKRAIITIAAVVLAPWLLWGALMVGGWALLLLVPAVLLYWGLTKEFYSRAGEGIWRVTRTKDTHLRTLEKEAATPKNYNRRRHFDHKHRHPVGAGVTYEP